MWWNNVETKPGTGYPGKWEDQLIYKGGWEKQDNQLKLKGTGKRKGLSNKDYFEVLNPEITENTLVIVQGKGLVKVGQIVKPVIKSN